MWRTPRSAPNYNVRKAGQFFADGEWTEAVRRYANAGGTLVREVMVAVAQSVDRPELASTKKLNQFRSLGESVAKQVGVSLARDPAWIEFTRVYGLRNTRYAMAKRTRKRKWRSPPVPRGKVCARCSQRGLPQRESRSRTFSEKL